MPPTPEHGREPNQLPAETNDLPISGTLEFQRATITLGMIGQLLDVTDSALE